MKAAPSDPPDDSPQDPGLSRLYQSTSRDEPPDWIDRRLLAEASHVAANSRPRRWVLPTATAALVLLGLSLSYQVFRETAPPAVIRTESDGDLARSPAMSAPVPAPLADTASQLAVPPALPRLPAEAAKTRAAVPKLQEMGREQGVVAIPESAEVPASLAGRAAKWPSREDLLTQIRAAIRNGETAKAHALIEQLLLAQPRQPLPEDLQGWRRQPGGDSPR